MVRSSSQNPTDFVGDNWIEIGALMPLSPRDPSIPRNRHISLSIYKRRSSIPSSTMVKSAIKTLTRNPRAGVSLVAIKKYIAENYSHGLPNISSRFRFVKRYIKNSLEKGELIRTKGVGISGSFRLPYTPRRMDKTFRKTIKKRKHSDRKKIKTIRKPKQRKSKEKSLKVNSKVSASTATGEGEGEDIAGDNNAGYASWTAEEPTTVKAVSKTSLRKIRKSNEVDS